MIYFATFYNCRSGLIVLDLGMEYSKRKIDGISDYFTAMNMFIREVLNDNNIKINLIETGNTKIKFCSIIEELQIELILLYQEGKININNLIEEIKKKFRNISKDNLINLDMSKRECLRKDVLELIKRHNRLESLSIN